MSESNQAAKTSPLDRSVIPSEGAHDASESERRGRVLDRRIASQDRRNPERAADDIAPRRHPNVRGRRKSDR